MAEEQEMSLVLYNPNDSTDDDGYADIEIYREEDEPLPNEPAYDKDFPTIEKRIQAIITGLHAVIPAELRQCHLFKHLADTAEALLQDLPFTPRKYRINIVGKSGAGKSSLLNSLLGRLNLARALSASKACTHVAASYESSFPGQQKAMAAKIVFRTDSEIESEIASLLEDYYSWTEERPQTLTAEERVQLATAASTAFDAFRSLFNRKDQFSKDSAGKAYLKDCYQQPRSDVVDRLVQWCLELVRQAQQSNGFDEFDDQDKLLAFIEPFAFSNSRYRKTALWPVVKLIRKGLSGVRILEYVTLTDWPGWDDTNRLRAQATEDRIHSCDELWFVSSADRIASDPLLTKRLGQYCHDVRCVVVCTHVEDKLDGGLAKIMEDDGEDIEDYDQLDAMFHDLKHKIRCSEGKLAKRKQARAGQVIRVGAKRLKIDSDTQARWVAEISQLELALDVDKNKLETIADKRLDLLVRVRKRYVDRLLQKQVFEKLEDGHFKVFCVSNQHYGVHKTGDFIKGEHLSAQATGIPDIRRYLFEEAARRILQDAKEFINTPLMVLLNGARLITSEEGFKGRETALRIIKEKEKQLPLAFNEYLASVKELARSELVDPLNDRQGDFVLAAKNVLAGKKRNWHSSSIKAFVRHEGCYATPSQPQQSWNEQFSEAPTFVLIGNNNNGCWRTFETEDAALFRKFKDFLVMEYKSIVTELHSKCGSSAGQIPKELHDLINYQASQIAIHCNNFRIQHAASLRDIKFDSTQADNDSPDSYFNAIMRPAWKKCQDISGRNSIANIVAVLEKHLTQRGEQPAFTKLAAAIDFVIAENTDRDLQELLDRVKKNFGKTTSWVQSASQKTWGDWLRPNATHERMQKEGATTKDLRRYGTWALSEVASINALIASMEYRCRIMGGNQALVLSSTAIRRYNSSSTI